MLDDIQRFLTIVQKKSLTKAAKELHMTQPALSLSLKRLEHELHAKLILRNGKQFILTDDGKAFYRIGQRIIELWEKALDSTNRKSTSRTVIIGMYDNAALQLAPFFHQYLAQKKNIEIKIDISQRILQLLQDGILDLCICILPLTFILPKGLVLIKTCAEQLIPVSSYRKISPELENILYILYNRGSFTREYIDKSFFKKGVHPNVLAESTSTSFMKELALTGSGVAILPENIVKHELQEKKLFKLRLPLTFHRTVGVFLRKDGPITSNDPFVISLLQAFTS